MMAGKKILITGATGQVAGPIAWELAKTNEVWALGRFGDPQATAHLEAKGIRTHRWDMGAEEIQGLPDDFTHVLHSAALRDTDDHEAAIHVNTVGTGQLMSHCRKAEAFCFVSSHAVYYRVAARDHAYAETDPQGGYLPWMPAYGPSKIATEGVVRAMAHTLGLPTVIARLNTSYGPSGHGGVPIRFFRRMLEGLPILTPVGGKDWHNPIHTDDQTRQTPLLWGLAATKPVIVNWAGDQMVSTNEMMEIVSDLTGVPVRFEESDLNRASYASDTTLRRRLIGDCQVPLREGLARTLEAMFPGAVKNP